MWIALACLALVLRLVVFWRSIGKPLRLDQGTQRRKFLVVLGSGGHTSEMLRLLQSLESEQDRFSITFVVADSDPTSLARIVPMLGAGWSYHVERIPRIRAVGESVFHAVLRIPMTFLSGVRIASACAPDVILVNGPGTCLPLVFASVVLQILFITPRAVLIFVESFCRVKTISLTGRLLYVPSDLFLLQWPRTGEIELRYPKAKYIGVLI